MCKIIYKIFAQVFFTAVKEHHGLAQPKILTICCTNYPLIIHRILKQHLTVLCAKSICASDYTRMSDMGSANVDAMIEEIVRNGEVTLRSKILKHIVILFILPPWLIIGIVSVLGKAASVPFALSMVSSHERLEKKVHSEFYGKVN